MTMAAGSDPLGTALADIDALMLHLFRLIATGLTKATDAFLTSDGALARDVIAADTEFDTLQDEIEELVERELATAPARLDVLPLLLSVVRIVPELERSGDLVEHIALRSSGGLGAQLTPTSRSMIGEMGQIATEMWRYAADAYAVRDGGAAAFLRRRDDELDDLHVRLTAELAEGDLPPASAIEMGLVARFYERLGDHAVNVMRRMAAAPAPASL